MSRLCPLAMLMSIVQAVCAQGTRPHENVSAYQAHADLGTVSIGADLLGHVFSIENEAYKSLNCIAIEVAFFGPWTKAIDVRVSQFELKVNGQSLQPESPGFVTLAETVRDMQERGPHVEAGADVGGVTMTAGRPVGPHFPGDPGSPEPPLPPATPETSIGQQQQLDPVKTVADAALPEGSHAPPVSGYLYFYYRGKLKRVKKAELSYAGPAGKATLVMR